MIYTVHSTVHVPPTPTQNHDRNRKSGHDGSDVRHDSRGCGGGITAEGFESESPTAATTSGTDAITVLTNPAIAIVVVCWCWACVCCAMYCVFFSFFIFT